MSEERAGILMEARVVAWLMRDLLVMAPGNPS